MNKRIVFVILQMIMLLVLSPSAYASSYQTASKGIDVSSYQGNIDWQAVASDNVEFAFIRCKSAVTGVDYNFDKNMTGASQNGIPTGIYYYSGATNDAEAIEEAQYIVNCANRHTVLLPLVIDIEGAMAALPKERLQRNIELFSSVVQSAGYIPMVYASSNFMMNHIGDVKIKKWIACYRNENNYTGEMDYWQYTSKGSVKGIAGNVDMNYSITYPDKVMTEFRTVRVNE